MPTTVLLMPTWSIIHSRFWKAQVPFLARHHRVVTFDGRGSGASGRPSGPASYGHDRWVADTLAVMEATGTGQAVLVALSRGAAWSLGVAADHPERVLGLFLIGSSPGFAAGAPQRLRESWARPVHDPQGWEKYNRHHWVDGGAEDFFAFFFDQMFPEPHSTQQVEDCIGWARETTPEVLVDTTAATIGLDGAVTADAAELCARVRCPVVVVHGTDDRISPPEIGRRLAELTGGTLVLMEGSGHGPLARDPVAVNHLLAEFVDRVSPPEPLREKPRPSARHRPRRVLYLSSPIGLGHARRDVAVAAALRERHPDVQVDWLAQHPVTAVLEAAGERVHPASRWLLSESAHVEAVADEHDLHAFDAVRGMDEVLVNNFMVFDEVVRETPYDLVVGDEAWDVDHLLHENPSLKRFAFAWMTDFVGLAADAGGRPGGGAADGRPQRADARAAGAVPVGAGPVGLRRGPRRRRARRLRPGPAVDPRLDPRPLRLPRLRHGFRPGRPARPRGAAGRAGLPRRTRGSAWWPWAGPGSATTCCGGCSTPCPSCAGRTPTCGSWWSPARASTRGRCRDDEAPGWWGTCRSCTATWPRATWRWCRAVSRRAWS